MQFRNIDFGSFLMSFLMSFFIEFWMSTKSEKVNWKSHFLIIFAFFRIHVCFLHKMALFGPPFGVILDQILGRVDWVDTHPNLAFWLKGSQNWLSNLTEIGVKTLTANCVFGHFCQFFSNIFRFFHKMRFWNFILQLFWGHFRVILVILRRVLAGCYEAHTHPSLGFWLKVTSNWLSKMVQNGRKSTIWPLFFDFGTPQTFPDLKNWSPMSEITIFRSIWGWWITQTAHFSTILTANVTTCTTETRLRTWFWALVTEETVKSVKWINLTLFAIFSDFREIVAKMIENWTSGGSTHWLGPWRPDLV